MSSVAASLVQHHDAELWTIEGLRKKLSALEESPRKAFLPSEKEWLVSIEKWKNDIPEGWHPQSFFDPLMEGDVGESGCTRIFICPEIFMEKECLHEDLKRVLDSHGYTKTWQQWKIKNAIVSMAMISTIALALACREPSFIDAPFSLGNCLPRSILFPFSGLEGKGCRHLIKDSRLLSEYNASSYNTLAFIEKSQEMTSKERWSNGNISGSYVRVHEKVNNITKTVLRFDGISNVWKQEKHWIGRKNLYTATSAMKWLVHRARLGQIRFIELDARVLKEWFIQCYVNHSNGKLKKGLKINARKDFPEVWKEWTGLRPLNDSTAPVEQYSSFSEAFKIHGQDIAEERLFWTTHIEKIARGLFIGSKRGMTLQEMHESEFNRHQRVDLPLILIEEKPKPQFIGTSEMQINVEFDPDGIENALNDSERPLNSQIAGQLEGMLANGLKDESRRWMRLHFRRRTHGRFYGYGNCVQMFPKWLRKKVFPSYSSIDLNCAVFSIMKSLLDSYGYSENTPEIDAMVKDKDSYRKSLVDESHDISLENVKDFLTMIGYGCTMNIDRIVNAAEWNWLVETYGIMPTLYDTYHYSPGSALVAGISDPIRLMQIASWASNERVTALWNEMQNGGNFLFGKMKKYAGGRPVLVNSWGEEMDIKSRRVTFGQKLAHIYQGAESMLLWNIMNGLEMEGMPVRETKYGFGVPMHDGFGLHKDIATKDVAHFVEGYVSSNVGWNLKYCCE